MTRLTTEQFLFGGWNDPTRLPPLEGFHCLQGGRGSDSADNLWSFDTFQYAISNIISNYAWDTEQEITVDHDRNLGKPLDHIQTFEMPDNATIMERYKTERAEAIDLAHAERYFQS